MNTRVRVKYVERLITILVVVILILPTLGPAQAASTTPGINVKPTFSSPVAFDVSVPMREMAQTAQNKLMLQDVSQEPVEIRPERGPNVQDQGYSSDGALQGNNAQALQMSTSAIPAPSVNFEGLSNTDNLTLLGFRVNPPDPMGDVGPNNYVELINLALAVYDKQGTMLLGPIAIGDIWTGFAINDCTDPSGDPVVLYDQFVDRWLLSQFTTRGPIYYNCVAITQTGDPTGAYYRYAFTTGEYFPDYPKYSVWTDSYIITTREFGPTIEYGIGVYAVEKNKMINGDPNARAVSFFIDGNDPALLPLIGDGLLPADIDGKQKPRTDTTIPLVGTQDDGGGYGATFDALNIWDLSVKWRSTPMASLSLAAQLPVAAFNSAFPCGPTSRDCLPQPGITNPAQYLDILSYRQRPTYRLAYRNFKSYETLVTNQSVEALPGIAGVRWYEIRRVNGVYSLYQQGTYAPDDGVHRWMGSIAQDKMGNMALGYSVVNGVDVYPGIRYTARLFGDALGQMTLGEGTVIDGSGVQRTTNSRWGDYTSMNIDPVDDCTFWYVNEYYTLAGQQSSTAGWQTRIASFKLPGCK